jgi:thiamine monophosphate kinase
VGQSLLELAAASGVAMHLDESLLPVSDISRRVAGYQNRDLADLVLGPGADFQLIGTVDCRQPAFERLKPFLRIIGTVAEGDGVWLKRTGRPIGRFHVSGWNYYLKNENT